MFFKGVIIGFINFGRMGVVKVVKFKFFKKKVKGMFDKYIG